MKAWTVRSKKVRAAAVPVLAVGASLAAGAVILLAAGKNPISAYVSLLQGSGLLPKANYAGSKNMWSDFTSLLNAWTPMILAALSVLTGLKAGLFNIGVSGQMLISGFIASILVGYGDLPAPAARLLVVFTGVLTGAAVGGFTGWLKSRFNVNEVVSTIMINYIVQYVVSFFIHGFYMNPVSRQSRPVSREARLTLTEFNAGGVKIDLPMGLILALASVVLIWFLFQRTMAGFELKAVGAGKEAAEYAGMKTQRSLAAAMTISGALAGLAGVTYYLGYYASIQPKVLPAAGFDAIAVALLGGTHPVGVLFASFLVTVISKGSTYMSSASGVEPEIASVITGLILLVSACSAFISEKIKRRGKKLD